MLVHIDIHLDPLPVAKFSHLAFVFLRLGVQVLGLSGVVSKDSTHFSEGGIVT